ncbi:RNA polymerase sigma-70 factor (ECF subfamily) [Nakamurella sp. UYEF19]|uniref:sigma-70 family RNA polymerase sigma factor n=1 Tax=Nakamurella sp. UYEF19 TaxID=1756392 RepID=UPI003398572C
MPTLEIPAGLPILARQPTSVVDRLLDRVSHGDQVAFDEVYAIFRARVFGICVALLRDRHQAEEVLQEAFLQIWRQASRFDSTRGGGTSWILKIAHARAVDRVRSCQADRRRDQQDFSRSAVAETDTVVESVLLNEEYARVRGALTVLSSKQRESLQLAYFQGLSTLQISDRLSVPVPTVKSRLRDGLAKLAAHLADVDRDQTVGGMSAA